MSHRRKPGVTAQNPSEQEMRDQEVLRANKELTSYFKGRRTEREARAALKIIKAFVRARERQEVASRPPLPAARAEKPRKETANGPPAKTRSGRNRGKPRRKTQNRSTSTSASPDRSGAPESPPRPLESQDPPTE